MRERVVRFGDPTELVGILTRPSGSSAGAELPGVVLLNSGILHRVGASRVYVRIARALAGDGFTVLRFDYSGIGDSEVRRDNLSFEESAREETRQAMDYMGGLVDSDRCILGGLCSGADMSFKVGVDDPRVTGIIQLDGWPYRSWQSLARYYGPRLLDWEQWKHSVRVRLEELGSGTGEGSTNGGEDDDYLAPEYRRVFPPKAEVEADLETLMERGVHLYYFFSGNYGKDYNYREQYRDAFSGIDFGDRLTVDYLSEANHLIGDLEHQDLVTNAIREWAAEAFGARELDRGGTDRVPEVA